MKEYFQFLRNIQFFNSLSDSDIKKIEAVCEEKYFKTGDTVFIEDSLGDNFFIILEGSVEIWKDYKEKKGEPLAVFNQGQLFGELALIDNFPRSATVIAREPCRLLSIHRDDFTRIITESGSISFSIMKSLSAMLRESTSNFMKDLKARNKYLEKAYNQLRKTDEQRVASLRQKELLIDRFHNLLKNNMQIVSGILSFQSYILKKKPDSCNHDMLISETKKRIHAMTLINDILFLSSNLLKVNIENYIYNFVSTLLKYLNIKDNIQLSVKAEEIFINPDDALILGMILNELVSNSVKYSFPDNRKKEIKITVYQMPLYNDRLELSFSDNGAGLPEKRESEYTDRPELFIVKSLTEEYLKGRFTMVPDNGSFIIQFMPEKLEVYEFQ